MTKVLTKKILILLTAIAPIAVYAQQTEIIKQEVCWNNAGVDSSLVRFILASPTSGAIQILYYTNADGTTVSPIGGSFSSGFCSCCNGQSGDSLNIYTQNSTISDPLRLVDLNDGQIKFFNGGNIIIESNRDAGMFSVKKEGSLDSLVFKNDFGIGGDYGLFLEGTSLASIFSATPSTLSIGSGFGSMIFESNNPINTNDRYSILVKDTVSNQVERIKPSQLNISGTQIDDNTIDKNKLTFEVPSSTRNINFSQNSTTLDTEFLVYISGIARTSNPYVLNDTMDWYFLGAESNHDYIFFDTIYPTNQGQLVIGYPTVRRVLATHVTVDETFSGQGVSVGQSTGLSTMTLVASYSANGNVSLVGDGAGGWTQSPASVISNNGYSSGTNYSLTSYNKTSTTFAHNINYVGTNNYRIRRKFSGLGIYNYNFVMVDNSTNADVVSNSTDDRVLINGWTTRAALGMFRWKPENEFVDGFANYWISGLMEAWMVARPVSTSSIKVRWQPEWPSSTTYKIYRDTNSDFSTETLIHTGTSGEYSDNGLSPNTLYFYRLVGVVSGLDVDITKFATTTEAF